MRSVSGGGPRPTQLNSPAVAVQGALSLADQVLKATRVAAGIGVAVDDLLRDTLDQDVGRGDRLLIDLVDDRRTAVAASPRPKCGVPTPADAPVGVGPDLDDLDGAPRRKLRVCSRQGYGTMALIDETRVRE